jgi:acyl-CoA synthetase (AMP-forming)/AMP-acid ligase II
VSKQSKVQPFDMSGIERRPDGVAHYLNRPNSLIQMLRATVEAKPDDEAVVELGAERASYRQLWDRAARVAGGLRAQGIAPGDRVAIRLPNGLDWVIAFFGAQLAGAIAVPVNTRFTEREAAYVINDSGARAVFEPGRPLPDGKPLALDSAQPDSVAALFYTSGTTGFPKGAMMTHANFLSNCETARRVVGIEPNYYTRNLVSVPLFHVTGCNSQLLVTLEGGGTTIVMPQFTVQAFLRAVPDERISVLTSVPAVFWLAIEQPNFSEFDMSSVRWLTYGGAPIAPATVHRIMQEFPNAKVGNGYGLTESSSIATFLPHEYCEEHADSVGFAAPVVDLDVFEPDPVSGVGELLIRAPNIVAGYWNKPEATAETFINGWLHTGDLARIDDLGLTYIVDRKKDMINRGGENVYCVEVENALAAHPQVFEVAVLGVADVMMGEKVGAVVVPTPGSKLSGEEVISFAKERLADFKVPQYLVLRNDPLPRNPGGKILKSDLRKNTDWGKSVKR